MKAVNSVWHKEISEHKTENDRLGASMQRNRLPDATPADMLALVSCRIRTAASLHLDLRRPRLFLLRAAL